MAWEQRLDLLRKDNCCNMIVEANLELVINLMKRINSTIALENVSKHWKLIGVFQRIQEQLQNLHIFSFQHVCRKAN